ncbi:unnamed protein product, partial [marine sediment metagenome]
DAYGEIGNDLGAHQSVGGARGNAHRVWARLNTDNAGGCDCALIVRAEVLGERHHNGRPQRKTCRNCGRRWESGETRCPECGTVRQGIDTRKTVFEVGLPDQAGQHCEVEIVVGNPALRRLATVGAFLCAVKGAAEVAQGDQQRGKATIRTAARILGELEEETQQNMPRVTLPGGVTLAHALACVQIVRDLIGGPSKAN